jgi:uncharacterized protein YeaO (DUF488 family)
MMRKTVVCPRFCCEDEAHCHRSLLRALLAGKGAAFA